MESSKDVLTRAADLIKKRGMADGMTITEEEMARKTGIAEKQLHAYLNGQDKTPDNLSSVLRNAYADFLNAIQVEANRKSLERTIVLVRNAGLARGMDITMEEMAQKAGI